MEEIIGAKGRGLGQYDGVGSGTEVTGIEDRRGEKLVKGMGMIGDRRREKLVKDMGMTS